MAAPELVIAQFARDQVIYRRTPAKEPLVSGASERGGSQHIGPPDQEQSSMTEPVATPLAEVRLACGV